MDDTQIHGQIEKLVAEEHELWQQEAAGGAPESDRKRLGTSASRSTSAGTCSGSAAHCATRAAAPMTHRQGRPRSSSATSSR